MYRRLDFRALREHVMPVPHGELEELRRVLPGIAREFAAEVSVQLRRESSDCNGRARRLLERTYDVV